MAELIKQVEFYSEKTDFENLLQRKPSSEKEFLKQVYFSKDIHADIQTLNEEIQALPKKLTSVNFVLSTKNKKKYQIVNHKN